MFKTPKEQLTSEWWSNYISLPENQYFKINAQQLAKNPILLDCLVPPEGRVFVQMDFASLEPYVLANYSGDETYKEIYASGKPHDVYLYVSCKLLDEDGRISEVYLPDNPTKESVKAAKKQFKRERSVGKVFQLMSTYKAGAPKIHRKLAINDIELSLNEVKDIRERYWGPELFGGIKDYEDHLLAEVDQRDGWMFNGLGRPFAITEKKRKDVVNTMIQSSGHDYTDLLILYFEQTFIERGLDGEPVIPDYHDETIWSFPTEQVDQAKQAMVDALKKLNDTIKLEIPLEGEPEVTYNFTDFKGPDPVRWYDEKKSLGK